MAEEKAEAPKSPVPAKREEGKLEVRNGKLQYGGSDKQRERAEDAVKEHFAKKGKRVKSLELKSVVTYGHKGFDVEYSAEVS